MLEPSQQHHVREYKRLTRRQLCSVLWGGGAVFVFEIANGALDAPQWVEMLVVVLALTLVAVAVFTLEIMKFLVFRKDLQERQGEAAN